MKAMKTACHPSGQAETSKFAKEEWRHVHISSHCVSAAYTPERRRFIQTTTGMVQRKFTRRIGSTTYRVTAHLSTANQETLEDKILRMMKNEIATEGVGKLEKSIENNAA